MIIDTLCHLASRQFDSLAGKFTYGMPLKQE